jgi:hypothetical protein
VEEEAEGAGGAAEPDAAERAELLEAAVSFLEAEAARPAPPGAGVRGAAARREALGNTPGHTLSLQPPCRGRLRFSGKGGVQ